MKAIELVMKRAVGAEKRIVFPEGSDIRIIAAARRSLDKKIAKPILIGNEKTIIKNAKNAGVGLKGIEIVDPVRSDKIYEYAKLYSKITKTPVKTSKLIARQPIFYSALALKNGDADGMIGGLVYTSGDFISVCKGVVGLKRGISVPSSYFIMDVPGYDGGENGALLYADASVNPNPTAKELADIAVTTGYTAINLLKWKPRIAMLSFSTKGSAVHPDVEKVVNATQIAIKKARNMNIDGELQADAALIKSTAKKKIKGNLGCVAGKANILIFPDLDAGNIAYKLTQILAGAHAYGPILQGFSKPVSDLSRGAKVDDILGVIAIVCVIAKEMKK